jgi:protein-S-isoprenylcysteine O-methyltransferase Ste14
MDSFSFVLKIFFAFLFAMAIFFLPVGRLDWIEAWAYLGLLAAYSILVGWWLLKHNPALAEKRASSKLPTKGWDAVILLVLAVCMLAQLVVAGLEERNTPSQMPLFLKIIGFVGCSIAFIVNFLVMKENSFLERIIEIQKNQMVVDTGPYAVVRHPMYAGFLFLFIGAGLLLGSQTAILLGIVCCIALIARTWLEDNTLKKELTGYKEYAKKVRYRLFPGVW